ncbi:recombination protein RecA [Sediminibacillus albus]|uniref:Protein RecA n=2 Tax=Sediminibacillus albus TaxID=407036 RepID=A0A1G8VY53_9BACI|nr:recombination protein RecA [Sediminibacillus albus]
MITMLNPETTPGGRALKFYSSVRLEVRRAETLKQGNDMVGNKTKIKVVKNKVAPPFKQAEVDIMYGEGISREGELLDIGSDLDIVQKSGAWYSYNEERLGQGRENAKQFLKENEDIKEEIYNSVRSHYNMDTAPEATEEKENQEALDMDV